MADAHRSLQAEAEHTDPPERHSAVGYLIILVAVAFLLLILAFFMQQRTTDSIQGLHDQVNQSVNAMESIDELLADNKQLRRQLEDLQEDRDALKDQLRVLQGQLAQTEAQLKATQTMLEAATATPTPSESPEP